MPVTSHMIYSISEMLNFDNYSDHRLTPSKFKIKNSFSEIKENKSYYLFNEYVDSGFMRINRKMIDELIQCADSKVKKGYNIIRVGTHKNKENSDIKLPFYSIDLRGKTSLVELFSLYSETNIRGSISFDTAIAHIGIIYDKEVFIKMRRFSKKYNFFVKKYIFPFYSKNDKSKINYI